MLDIFSLLILVVHNFNTTLVNSNLSVLGSSLFSNNMKTLADPKSVPTIDACNE